MEYDNQNNSIKADDNLEIVTDIEEFRSEFDSSNKRGKSIIDKKDYHTFSNNNNNFDTNINNNVTFSLKPLEQIKEVNEEKSNTTNQILLVSKQNDTSLLSNQHNPINFNKVDKTKTLKDIQQEEAQESKNPMYQEIRDSAMKLKPIMKKSKEAPITLRDDFIKDEGMRIALEQVRKYQKLEGSIAEDENSFDD